MRKYFFCLGAYLTENQGVSHSFAHELDVCHWHQMYSVSHWHQMYSVSHWHQMYSVSHWHKMYSVSHWHQMYSVSHWHKMYSVLNNVGHNVLTKMWTEAVIRLVRRCQYYENHKSSVRIAVLSRFEPWNSGNTKHKTDHSNTTRRLIKNGD